VTTLELPVPVPGVRRPVRLALPGRTLLLVAGMPGAGKSTLLSGLPRTPDVAVLDSDEHRAALARRLPGVAYRRYRPLVHLRHRLAVLRAACSATPTVVVHLPATGAGTRRAVALLAALTGRDAHLLWLHVDPREALAGQRERGRLVPSASFAGHARRAAAAVAGLGREPGWRSRTVIDRAGARAGLVLDTVLDERTGR
jgi:predicted kinase